MTRGFPGDKTYKVVTKFGDRLVTKVYEGIEADDVYAYAEEQWGFLVSVELIGDKSEGLL